MNLKDGTAELIWAKNDGPLTPTIAQALQFYD